ncbi:MAG TPA: hypothetical protein VIS76_07430 [Pseudomonadales bacterium]
MAQPAGEKGATGMALVGPSEQPVLDEPALLGELVVLDGGRMLELGCGAVPKRTDLIRATDSPVGGFRSP